MAINGKESIPAKILDTTSESGTSPVNQITASEDSPIPKATGTPMIRKIPKTVNNKATMVNVLVKLAGRNLYHFAEGFDDHQSPADRDGQEGPTHGYLKRR